MYAQRLIELKMRQWAIDNGWELVYHSVDQVQEFIQYIQSITKVEATSRRQTFDMVSSLPPERIRYVKRFIQNEQMLCTYDEGYWASRYAYICDEKGEILKFVPRESQKVFDSIVAHFEDLEVAIELLVLKARQVGISTRVALKFLHRMLFIPHVQAVMASVQADKSELIGRILKICYERCPWWLVPQQTGERVGKHMEFSNGSVLSIQSGMQPTGIGQGWTPTLIHISELADIPNPKKVIEEGLIPATHPTRKLLQVHEGTGGGNTGWLADTWRACKEDFPRGLARFCPTFISWPLATDLYPEADWLRKFPIPDGWTPMAETRKHVTRCELYIRSTEYLAKICGTNWKMPRHQQWFWEFNYRASVKKHTQKIWLSQMPADDYEALTGKNDLVFDQEVIEVREQERKHDYDIYAITGNSIDDGFEVDTELIDYEKERILIDWDSHRGNKYHWVLIPLLPFDERDERRAFDKLLVFEPPQAGRDYSMGVDTADGLGHEDEDRCVINLTQSAVGNHPDIQVAEFTSNRINPPQTVGFAAAIAAWYGPKCRDPRGVKFCIEQRERPGDDCQLQLKLMGFSFQHLMTRYDSKKVSERMGVKEGWYSNQWSVPFLMNRFVDAVNGGWYQVNSKYLLLELKDLERKTAVSGKTKMEHQTGKHDDRVRAAAHAYITRHHLDVLQERSTKTYAVRSGHQPELNVQYPQLNAVAVDDD
jgi:hypothetical protein